MPSSGSHEAPPSESPPHSQEPPKELRETETEFLADFHSLTDLSTKLEPYTENPEKLKELTNHFRELYKAIWPRPPEARQRIPDQIDSIAPPILERTDLLLRQFLASDTLQNLFKQTIGQEIHSTDEARELRKTLLSPLTERFKAELPTSRDFTNLPLNNPERKAEISRIIRTVTTDNPDWPQIVTKLKLLPGSHQPLLTECLTSQAEECWQRFLEYGNPPTPKHERQLDIDYSENELIDLYQTLTDANTLISAIQSKHPSLPSPESLPPKPERKPRETEPKEFTELRNRETIRLKAYFGPEVTIEVPPLPTILTPELLRSLESHGFALEYDSKIDLTEDKTFPGQPHKLGKRHTPNQSWGIEFYDEANRILNLPDNKANPNLSNLKPTELTGRWVARDKRPKPYYTNGTQRYENDTTMETTLKRLVTEGIVNQEASAEGRNFIHPSVFGNHEFWQAIKQAYGLNLPGVIARLPRAIEANYAGQGSDYHDTSTWEWNEEYCQSLRRLVSGYSECGGASFVYWDGRPNVFVGFRPLIIFPER